MTHIARCMTLAVMTLAAGVAPAVAQVDFSGEWAPRFSCLWMIPAIEARERAGDDVGTPEQSGRQYLTAAVAHDLALRQPTFVLIEEARSRLLDDIVSAPIVRESLRAYRRVGRVGALSVWVRGTDVPID